MNQVLLEKLDNCKLYYIALCIACGVTHDTGREEVNGSLIGSCKNLV